MNNSLFQQANQAYERQDYQAALQGFTQCLQEVNQPAESGEIGLLYHQIGNCLIKLKNSNEAITAYTQATLDASYPGVSTVNYNLGMAYASLHDYENAVKFFEAAVADPEYATPYKAYSGMGSALIKLGKSAEAGAAFRSAALDESNPDPTKALLNLGVCFMALNRPNDAIFSYESALQFDMQPATRNKIYASLGQACVAAGQMQKAVTAFEQALADKTYFLSDSASVDYQTAIAAVAQGTATDMAPVAAGAVAGVAAGVAAGAAFGAAANAAADTSGLDVDGSYGFGAVDNQGDMYGANGGYAGVAAAGAYQGAAYQGANAGMPNQNGMIDTTAMVPGQWPQAQNPDAEGFFAADGAQWEQPKKKHTGLKVAIVILVILICAAGAAVFGYTQGYGFPTQDSVASELFANPSNKEVYASSVTEEQIEGFSIYVVTDTSATINGVEKGMSTSKVYVSAKTSAGGTVQYCVTMLREGIGWKVSDIELYFASKSGSSSTSTQSATTNSSSSNSSSSTNSSTNSSSSSSTTNSGSTTGSTSSSTSTGGTSTGGTTTGGTSTKSTN